MGVISWLNQHKPITLMGPHVIIMSSLRCFGDRWLCPPLGGHFLGHSPPGLPRWPVDLEGGGDDGGLPGCLQSLGDAGAEEQRGVSLLWADGNSEMSIFSFFLDGFSWCPRCFFVFRVFLMVHWWLLNVFGVPLVCWSGFCWFRCWYWICMYLFI
jgi:hypothetical protein